MTVEEAIRTRRSTTRLGDEMDVSVVGQLLQLAVWAPNHHLTEPWTFTVVTGSARDRLADTWAEDTQTGLDSALSSDVQNKLIAAERAKIYRAPVLVFVAVRPQTGNPVTDQEDLAATAAATQNLLLLAHAKGLGAIWRTGKMARSVAVKACLGIHPEARVVAVVYLGAPKKTVPERPRNLDVIRWLA